MWLEADGDKIINLNHVREIQAEKVSGGGSKLVAVFADGHTTVLRQFPSAHDAQSVLRGHLIERQLKGNLLTLPPMKAPS